LLSTAKWLPLRSFAGVNGYLDELDVRQVGPFEQGLLANLRAEHKELLDTIGEKKALDDDLTAQLKAALDAFAKTFA